MGSVMVIIIPTASVAGMKTSWTQTPDTNHITARNIHITTTSVALRAILRLVIPNHTTTVVIVTTTMMARFTTAMVTV
jgi:hypothetical protein